MTHPWPVTSACPQCGSAVDLAAGDPVLACPYCRTRLYLAPKGPLRYVLPPVPGVELARRIHRLLYLPFWRFRGLRFRVLDLPPRIEAGLLDTTTQACELGLTSTVLGISPQVAPLALATEGEGRFLPTEQTNAAALAMAEGRLAPFEDRHPLFERFVGENQSLIYAPLLLDNDPGPRGLRLQEAWGEAHVHHLDPDRQKTLLETIERPQQGSQLAFLPLLCPECGNDLPAARGAAALLCPHCARAWWVQGQRFAPLPYAVQAPSSPDSRLFPFWHTVFRTSQMPLKSRADLSRLAIPYQPVPAGWEYEPCQALLPAFKTHPRLFLRLASLMSLSPHGLPQRQADPGFQAEVEPVRLSLTEAAQALKVVLAQLMLRQRRTFPQIRGGRMKLHRAHLVYLPFRHHGAEWVGEQSGIAIPKAAVGWGANL